MNDNLDFLDQTVRLTKKIPIKFPGISLPDKKFELFEGLRGSEAIVQDQMFSLV
jgi:hypothetical protein